MSASRAAASTGYAHTQAASRKRRGFKLPSFELPGVSKIEFATVSQHISYRAVPYMAATSFCDVSSKACEVTVKLTIVHFVQLDRDGVGKV